MANKKRLIDANALLAGICKDCGNGCDLENNYCLLATEIMKAPTVDAVEVVRCKDCKYCRTFYPIKEIGKEAIQVWYCDLYRCNRKTDEFCSDGERREGE